MKKAEDAPRRRVVDSRGAWCPPTALTDLFKAVRSASIGDEIELRATEPTVESDVRAWAKKSGNRIIAVERLLDQTRVVVEVTRKGRRLEELAASKKSMTQPDQEIQIPNGRLSLAMLGGFTMGLRTLEPGWRWSRSMKPIVHTDTCETHHIGYMISGRMAFAMQNGTSLEVGPGDAFDVHPGHDAWTVGRDPAVFMDLIGAVERATKVDIGATR